MTRRQNKKRGFTLIELVVVAGIISLLVSIILASLDTSRAKARDTKKISELKSLQNALELYQLDIGYYPIPDTQPAKNENSGLTTMTATLDGIVNNAHYLSAIPMPPTNSTVNGADIYYYQTEDVTGADPLVPACNEKLLGETPYIIYFYTEQPHNLPKLKINGVDQDNGYCLAL